ncbi:uncharacterized protein [Watersipora subatra]|uniref:uncharacterized protein n=1 Tax=Watersipora subatra TaxID=2589382 RepID=UPI00355BF783
MATPVADINGSSNESKLLECIDRLHTETRSDLPSIQSAMLESHGQSYEQTEAMINSLTNSTKIFKVERKGVTHYLTIKTENHLRRSGSVEVKEVSELLARCVKAINQGNGSAGASVDEIINWLGANGGPAHLSEKKELEATLQDEVSLMKIKTNATGLYFSVKRRGRPCGSPSNAKSKVLCMPSVTTVKPSPNKSPSTKSTMLKRSPEETHKRTGNLGKRKRIKKSNEDYEFYDTPGNTSMHLNTAGKGEPICDFCLKSSSCNRQSMFEELLLCKDCNAKAHPSCMGYCEVLARRASMGPWQCIDCKTCCLCLESGHPDDLLFCDACDKGYHMFCHSPAIKEKPKNKWACNACIHDGVCPEDLITDVPEDGMQDQVTDSAADTGVSGATHPLPTSSNGPTISNSQSNMAVEVKSPSNSSPAPAGPTQAPLASPKVMLPEVPSHWSVTHVSQYIHQCGFPAEAQRFYEQEIDGKSFMLLMRQDVLCNMNLKLGPALKIYEKIKMLQKGPAVRLHQQ